MTSRVSIGLPHKLQIGILEGRADSDDRLDVTAGPNHLISDDDVVLFGILDINSHLVAIDSYASEWKFPERGQNRLILPAQAELPSSSR